MQEQTQKLEEQTGQLAAEVASSREALQKLIINLSHQPLHYFFGGIIVIDFLVICSGTIC